MSKQQQDEESFGKSLLEVVLFTAIFAGILFALFHFVWANARVQGPSMQPTFESNDRIIAVRHTQLRRGDIVILNAPDEPGAEYIKRIIGLPGDTVSSKNDTTYVNGRPIKEPYLDQYKSKLPMGQLYTNNFTLKSTLGRKRVPKGCYFVMGDHRNVSKDSRIIGFIKRSAIIGKVEWRYYPLNKMKTF